MSIGAQDYEGIIAERLSFKDTHIQRFLMKYEDFLGKLDSAAPSEIEKLGSDLIIELNSMTFLLSKNHLLYDILEKDESQENEALREIDLQIKSTKIQITELQKEYELQKVIQNNKGEYENIASVIVQYNDHQTIQNKIGKSEAESKYLIEGISSISDILLMKKKQTHLLATMLSDMLKEDAPDEEEPMGD